MQVLWRFVRFGVVASWLVLMGMLVRDHFAASERIVAPPADTSASAAVPDESWMGVYMHDRKIGYTHERVVATEGGHRFAEDSLLRLTVMDAEQTVHTHIDATTGPDYALRTFSVSLQSGRRGSEGERHGGPTDGGSGPENGQGRDAAAARDRRSDLPADHAHGRCSPAPTGAWRGRARCRSSIPPQCATTRWRCAWTGAKASSSAGARCRRGACASRFAAWRRRCGWTTPGRCCARRGRWAWSRSRRAPSSRCRTAGRKATPSIS